MSERSYTVSELDALRRVCENKWLFGSYGQVGGVGCNMSRSYKEAEKTTCVEQLARTHMLAGHTAQDLYASEAKATSSSDAKQSGSSHIPDEIETLAGEW